MSSVPNPRLSFLSVLLNSYSAPCCRAPLLYSANCLRLSCTLWQGAAFLLPLGIVFARAHVPASAAQVLEHLQTDLLLT